MRPFNRQKAPAFWSQFEQRWRDMLNVREGCQTDPLRWHHENRSLAHWFHENVSAPGEPHNCAYCDGDLGTTSGHTIDHFVPRKLALDQSLEWDNLFPACTRCNSHYKGDRCPWGVARPDRDPVEDWLEFDPTTGQLRPRPGIKAVFRRRARRAIWLFQLNTVERCTARRRLFRDVHNAALANDSEQLTEAKKMGPYRFVVEAYLAAKL